MPWIAVVTGLGLNSANGSDIRSGLVDGWCCFQGLHGSAVVSAIASQQSFPPSFQKEGRKNRLRLGRKPVPVYSFGVGMFSLSLSVHGVTMH